MIIELPNLTRAVEDDPCFPLFGELIRMLEQDMNCREAVYEHCTNFGFDDVQGDNEHDLSHVLLGLAFLKMGYDPIGLRFSYNNNFLSENIVRRIEAPINSYITGHAAIENLRIECLEKLDIRIMAQNTFPWIIDMAKESSKRVNILMDLASKKPTPTSYFELLVSNEHTAKNYDNKEFLDMGRDFSAQAIKPSEEELQTIYALLRDPVAYIVNYLADYEEKQGKAFARKHHVDLGWQEEANTVLETMKLRDLWNFMPSTEQEPYFVFSKKFQRPAHLDNARQL